MAFLLAGIVLLGALAFATLQFFAEMMKPSGGDGRKPIITAMIGFVLAVLVAATYWIGW